LSETTTTTPSFPPLLSLSKNHPAKPPYGFTPINQAQMDYITAEEPNVFFWGNRGGGKSVTARWTCHARALSYPGYKYAILRTSFPELTKNHLIYLPAEMREIWGGKDKGWNASKYIATYPNGSMGFYMQAETEEQVKNALGVEMYEVVFDEAPTFQFAHTVMIASSVRVPKGSGLTPLKRYNGNPIGPSINDLWKYFIDKDVDRTEDRDYNPAEWRGIEIKMEDNSELDVEAYRKQLGVGLPEHIRKAWLDGEKFEFGQAFDVHKTITEKLLTEHAGRPREIPLDVSRMGQPYHILNELPEINGKPLIWFDYA
jgi:hypothetical protein